MGLPSRMTAKEFSKMVDAMQGKLFRFAFHFLNDIQEAEDAVQESLAKFWQKREHSHEIAKPEAFMMTIVRNESLDRIKSRKKESRVSLEQDHAEILEDDSIEERVLALRKAIRELPDGYRSVIHLRDVEGLRYEEIQRVLDLSLSDVKIRIHRGRKLLKEKLIPSNGSK